MSNSNRRQYLTSTVLDQAFLDASQDNLECRLEMICEIETPEISAAYTSVGTVVTVASAGHPYLVGEIVEVTTAPAPGDLLGSWEVTAATATDFSFDVGGAFSPASGTLGYVERVYASDRNKYVGNRFYEALLNFPVIGRTVGEWLVSELQFSTLTLELSNVDGRFNKYLPAGEHFGSWIGKQVLVKIGLAEQAATYNIIFRGKVTDVGGFKRNVSTITIIARDDYDRVNVSFPKNTLKDTDYPKIEDKNVGKNVPVIYGDWTIELDPSPAGLPAIALNGKDPLVDFKDRDVTITSPATPAIFTAIDHNFDDNDPVEFTTTGVLPSPLSAGVTYYVRFPATDTFELALAPAGASINTVGGQSGTHKVQASTTTAVRRNVSFIVSDHDLTLFALDGVYLKRSSAYSRVPVSEIASLGAGFRTFTLKQKSGVLWVSTDAGGVEYEFDGNDEFYVTVKGKDLSGYDDNIVAQAMDVLETYGGLDPGDFDANWATYRDKAAPAESAIATSLSRAWIQEPVPALSFALSLLEQVRLEAFVDRDLMFKLNALHFEDWVPSPTHVLFDWDVEEDSFKTSTDERNLFNRAQAVFNFIPERAENTRATDIYRNQAAIDQVGKEISKRIVFPNLYQPAFVAYQLIETMKIASSGLETIEASLTWRSLLLDNGGFVKLNVQIGSSIFTDVPVMLRSVGFDPAGPKVVINGWSTQMLPFPGYTPGYSGIVGGYNAVITAE